jgi:hypothetical protein
LRLVDDSLALRKFSREQLAGLWPEEERPYERCMCLIDAIEITRKQKSISNPNLSEDEKFEEVEKAIEVTRIKMSPADPCRLPDVIKPAILKPKSISQNFAGYRKSTLLLMLKDDKVTLDAPIKRGYNWVDSYKILLFTWIIQQILNERTEIRCFFENFKLCGSKKDQCNSCAVRKYIQNGLKLSEIFKSVETEMSYFQKVSDKPPEDQ